MRSHREYGIKVVFGAALRNWDTLLIFEILYRSFGFLVWFPVQRYLLSLLPALVGERYLGQDNLVLVFRHPGALAVLAGVLLMTGLFIFFEIITLFLYCEKGWERERVTARALVKEAGGKAAGLFVPRRLSVFLLLPALMFSAFSFISGYLEAVSYTHLNPLTGFSQKLKGLDIVSHIGSDGREGEIRSEVRVRIV